MIADSIVTSLHLRPGDEGTGQAGKRDDAAEINTEKIGLVEWIEAGRRA